MRARLLSLLLRAKTPPIALGIVAAVALIGVETLALFPFHGAAHQDARGAVYLIGVLVVSIVWGAALGVATSLASALAFNYFHVLPYGVLNLSTNQDLQDLAIFIVAALLVSGLADLARAYALETTERRREADLAAELARLMLGAGDLRSALDLAARRIAQALDLPAASIELQAVAGDERRAALPLRDGLTTLGTLLVPADLPEHTLERLRRRMVPSLEPLLRAAYDRETITNSLKASRQEAGSLAVQQAALRRVATLVAHGAAPAKVFDAVTEELGRVLGHNTTALLRYEPDGTVTRLAGRNVLTGKRSFPLEGDSLLVMVLRTHRAARIHTYDNAVGPNAEHARELGLRSGVAVPIIVDGRIWGVAVVMSTEPEPLPAEAETRMADFTDLVATAIANADSHAQLTASRARIVAAGDNARRRIEQDLHDGAQQRLIALGLQLRMMETSVPAGLDTIRQQLSQVANGLNSAFQDLQEISRGIHPAILSKGGLGPAIKSLARRSPTPVDLTLSIDRRLPERVAVGAYYIVSEALTNAAKHAQATLVRMNVEADDATLRLFIRDDGIGGADAGKGSGLIGLQDRIEALGGHMDISSPAGQGTALLVSIPIRGTPATATGPKAEGLKG
ncbi:DUF4118 domain-containing protein [Dactylosporangium sp. NPDC048998]|uniref:sensor histidine kinase n=1 Tax=Dactylosporangium sp. NPDC048998 TaxID=3363976 RepID=UPI00370F888B